MKILELFSGYGTASFALKRLVAKGIIDKYVCVGYSDIDKYANQCFKQNHKGQELGDCTKIDPNELEDFDLLTGGFPCQAFSVAGKGLGELDTRGTLFNEIIRIAEVKKPKYMLLENVKGLISKRHQPTFQKILSELERIGYHVHWKVLNTKDYGIPQNRERVWFVCFRDYFEWKNFKFPEKEELVIGLYDILDKEVDNKFIVVRDKILKIVKATFASRRALFQGRKMVYSCLAARDYKEPKVVFDPRQYKGEQLSRAYDNISPTLMARARTDESPIIRDDDRFRFITPKECFRLQGFLNDEVNLEGLSNTQQYKLAGNGQSVNVVEKIFERMFNNGI